MLYKNQELGSVILIVILLVIIAHGLSGRSISYISRRKVKKHLLLTSFQSGKSKIHEVKVRNSWVEYFIGLPILTEALVPLIYPSTHPFIFKISFFSVGLLEPIPFLLGEGRITPWKVVCLSQSHIETHKNRQPFTRTHTCSQPRVPKWPRMHAFRLCNKAGQSTQTYKLHTK